MNELHKKIARIKVELQNSKLKKTGFNKHAGFQYFELADFLPQLNELMEKHGVCDMFFIDGEFAKLILTDGNSEFRYTIPFKMFDVPLSSKGNPMMQEVQYLGAINTYYKRYLYMNAFGITDGEIVDSIDSTEIQKPKINEGSATWSEAVKYLQNGGSVNTIKKKYSLTNEQEEKLAIEANG